MVLIIPLILIVFGNTCDNPVFPNKNYFTNTLDVMSIWNDFQSNSVFAYGEYGGIQVRDYKYHLISVNDIDFIDNNGRAIKLLNKNGTAVLSFHFNTIELPLVRDWIMTVRKGDDLELICQVFRYKYSTLYKKVENRVISTGRVTVFDSDTYKTEFSATELSFNKCYPVDVFGEVKND